MKRAVKLTPTFKSGGFSLVELLLALFLGMGLLGVMLQCLMAQGRNSGQLVRILREKSFQRRTLDLVATDLRQATGISLRPEVVEPACALAGRTPILHLETDAGPITYSLGHAPSPIWRGKVLMRCGPAYDLFGTLSGGKMTSNRVVIDGLPNGIQKGFVASLNTTGGPLDIFIHQHVLDSRGKNAICSQRSIDLIGVNLL